MTGARAHTTWVVLLPAGFVDPGGPAEHDRPMPGPFWQVVSAAAAYRGVDVELTEGSPRAALAEVSYDDPEDLIRWFAWVCGTGAAVQFRGSHAGATPGPRTPRPALTTVTPS